MKIFRFMSNKEFQKFKCSNKLKNDKIHQGKTNSIGFCFLNLDDYSPEEAMHFLSGIVSFDVCAVFETKKQLNKKEASYAKPIDTTGNILTDIINLMNGWNEEFKVTEYCCTEYDNKTFKLLKYSTNIWQQWKPLEKQLKLKWEENNNEIQTIKRIKGKNGKRNKTI